MNTPQNDAVINRRTFILQSLEPLTDDDRITAHELAKVNTIRQYGERPTREQFKDVTISEYPRWFNWSVSAVLTTILLMAAAVSFFRVFTAARDHFAVSIDVAWQAGMVGVAMFVMAELMVLISTLAVRMWFRDKRSKWFFYILAGMSAAIAIVGNAVVTQPIVGLSLDSGWSLLETLSPPFIVMGVALMFERIIDEAMRTRQATENAYQQALADWEAATAKPEKLPLWGTTYRRALWDVIREANKNGRGAKERRELMNSMNTAEKLLVVARELSEEELWQAAANPQKPPTAADSMSYSGNGKHLATAVLPVMPNTNGNGLS